MLRTVSLLLVLLAAVPHAALAGDWFRCRYDGKTRATRCCPERERAAKEARPAEMRRTPCCDVLRNEPRALSARAEARGDVRLTSATAHAAITPAPMVVVSASARVSRAPSPRALAPPGEGQPLYLSNSSLLL